MGNSTVARHITAAMSAGTDVDLQGENDVKNFYASFVRKQNIAIISSFTLESGITLEAVPVAYSTWGALNESKDNVLVICHALTGSSDAADWWCPLFGPDKALDYTRYFIFCANVLGSPYGSASPLSTNPATGLAYGPSFPATTIRDDVRIHKLVLDALGVQGVAAVIGGSMGGMTTLEWPLCTPPGYVGNIIPIATSAYLGAWGISWSETQRQPICTDTAFKDGWYDPVPEGQPRQGLGAARMIAMLTYRSHSSFEARFSRKPTSITRNISQTNTPPTPPSSHRGSVSTGEDGANDNGRPGMFAAQSYLQYQADKFLMRFDANCYLHLTRKMDTHDITRDRILNPSYPPSESDLAEVFKDVPAKALVVGVQTDILFTLDQQHQLARCLPGAHLVTLDSRDGHDGFLLEFGALDAIIKGHLRMQCSCIYTSNNFTAVDLCAGNMKNSIFGEVDVNGF